jgi:hypothetical protein
MEELAKPVIAEGGVAAVVTLRGSETDVNEPFIAVTTTLYDVSSVNPLKVAVLEATPLSAEGVAATPSIVYV